MADRRAHSRRTVLRTAAWSLPVIAVAATVPHAAASGEETPVIGDFWESSIQIGKTKVAMSALFVDCAPGTTKSGWAGRPFDATIVIEYFGDNDMFSFLDVVNTTHWVLARKAQHRLEFTSTMVVNGCGTGSLQFHALDITFNGGHEKAPVHEPGPNSIRVTATAIAQDGSFAVGSLLDATPCSPTKGAVPIGPRDVPGSC